MSSYRAEFRVPAEASAVASARRFTEAKLADWDLEHLTDTMNLLVTETVTNAVVHGGTSAHLALVLGNATLRVEVRDGSSAKPRMKDYSLTATTGRGMQIVDALADRWGADELGGGKVVWFELDLAGSAGENDARAMQGAEAAGLPEPTAAFDSGTKLVADTNGNGQPMGQLIGARNG